MFCRRAERGRVAPPSAAGGRVLPDLSVFWVIGFVLLLTAVLDRLLFKPILRVIQQREGAIRSARELAERSANEARAATAELEAKTAAARAEIYRQMDEMRRAALGERAEILTRTRAEAEAEIAGAVAQLQAETEEARRRLAADAEALGAAAAERILGRKAS
jgi:F-type H+-transporting ATPase subunit b